MLNVIHILNTDTNISMKTQGKSWLSIFKSNEQVNVEDLPQGEIDSTKFSGKVHKNYNDIKNNPIWKTIQQAHAETK